MTIFISYQESTSALHVPCAHTPALRLLYATRRFKPYSACTARIKNHKQVQRVQLQTKSPSRHYQGYGLPAGPLARRTMKRRQTIRSLPERALPGATCLLLPRSMRASGGRQLGSLSVSCSRHSMVSRHVLHQRTMHFTMCMAAPCPNILRPPGDPRPAHP